MEIENERAARTRDDKRVETLKKSIEALRAASGNQVGELVATRTSLEHERREVELLRAITDEAVRQREMVGAALTKTKLAIERAEAEARTSQAAMAQLLPLIPDAKPKHSPRGEEACRVRLASGHLVGSSVAPKPSPLEIA